MRDGLDETFLQRVDDLQINQRSKEIAKRCAKGETYKSVGIDFGLSQERIRTIYVAAFRAVRFNALIDENPDAVTFPFNRDFPVRVANCIKNLGWTEAELLKKMQTLEGFSAISETPNLGKKSVRFLYDFYNINPPLTPHGEKSAAIDDWKSGKITSDEAMRIISQT